MAFPKIPRHFLQRSVTLSLELMRSDLGDDCNAAGAVIGPNGLFVCYRPGSSQITDTKDWLLRLENTCRPRAAEHAV
jgi:hypothetical protein